MSVSTVEELVEGDAIELDGEDVTVTFVVSAGPRLATVHYARGRYVYARTLARGETFEVSR